MPTTQTTNTSASLVHAVLNLYEPGPQPGKPGGSLGEIKFQFNPKELTFTKAAKWESKNGKKSGAAPPVSYTSPEPQKLSLEMFFDEAFFEPGHKTDGGVVHTVERLFSTLVPTESTKSKEHPSPPWVQFSWGGLHSFVGYVKSVSAKYTRFGPDGKPTRAVCTVALEELASEKAKQNPTSGGLMPRRVHTIREGDSLALIAYREYGQASLWRPLAEVNDIDDPMRLRPGRIIFVPAAQELENAGAQDAAAREIAQREVQRARA